MIHAISKSQPYCQYFNYRMREFFDKSSHQYITIRECAQYLGLDPDEVDAVLNGGN